MKTFIGWDFDETWAIGYDDNGTFYVTYPYLKGMRYDDGYPGQEVSGSISGTVTVGGAGSAEVGGGPGGYSG